MVSSPGSLEAARQRLSFPANGSGKRAQRSMACKDVVGKLLASHLPDQRAATAGILKFRSLKLVLLIIICGAMLILFYSPAPTDHHASSSSSSSATATTTSKMVDDGWTMERSSVPTDRSAASSSSPSSSAAATTSKMVDDGWTMERSSAPMDPRYVSNSDVDWSRLSSLMERIDDNGDDGRQNSKVVGLLNFNLSEVHQWRTHLPDSELHWVGLDSVGEGITWENLYPEWIDEEEELEVPSCPHFPDPELWSSSSSPPSFGLVVVKLPCDRSKSSWSRDVARLHLQLSAAKLSASTSKAADVLFFTDCLPVPNLFTCDDLLFRDGNAWLYRPSVEKLHEKLSLPIGSCKLAVSLKETLEGGAASTPIIGRARREAYATILHSASMYVCGAIVAAQSLRLAGSTRDLVILVDENISDESRRGLEAAGWKVRTIQRIRNPKAERDAYNEWNYSKFRLWQLTDYDRVIFIDADLLILRNIDFLFSSAPEISATGNNATLFNSGVMVIEPSNCTFRLLMDGIDDITSYNGGDQGYLNEVFTWWHRVSKRLNFLKHFWEGDSEKVRRRKKAMFRADPPELHVLHYLGYKPWLCFRDYDCNWDVGKMQEYASDEAHATWWKVHDAMPEGLRGFCLLRTRQKAGLEWNRRQARKAKLAGGRWKRKIRDPRLGVCGKGEMYCSWENMLLHWGESTDSNSNSNSTNPEITS